MFVDIARSYGCRVEFSMTVPSGMYTFEPDYGVGVIHLPFFLDEKEVDDNVIWRSLAYHELGHHLSHLHDCRLEAPYTPCGNGPGILACEEDAWRIAREISSKHGREFSRVYPNLLLTTYRLPLRWGIWLSGILGIIAVAYTELRRAWNKKV